LERRIAIASKSLHVVLIKESGLADRGCPELEVVGGVANKASNRSGCKFI
jgi:hypothetical protein